MSEGADTAATRLWRDRVQMREQERNEAQARAHRAEEQVVLLNAENDRLAHENALVRGQNDRLAAEIARLNVQKEALLAEITRLRAGLGPDAADPRTETEAEMAALRDALVSLVARQ